MRLRKLTVRCLCSISFLWSGWRVSGLVLMIVAVFVPIRTIAQSSFLSPSVRESMHDTANWPAIEQHLPSRVSSPPEVLEQQGDVLRARRFPLDANDYYNFALQNGGDPAVLMDKIGLTVLDMKEVEWARSYFRRVVEIDPRSADGWSNLGTVEYLSRRVAFAIADYEHAVKLDKGRAVFHCNLATIYFARGNMRDARREIAAALKLDPMAFDRESDEAGAAVHLLSSEGRGEFAFEMAKIYARSGAEGLMLHSLAMSSEAGFDVRHEMRRDAVLSRYASDPRVIVLVHNAEALRGVDERGGKAAKAVRGVPPLEAAMVAPE
jgi:tetratricopeptide (TPR) repeat protein